MNFEQMFESVEEKKVVVPVSPSITSYRQFYKLTSQDHSNDENILVSFATLMELRVKIDEYREATNALKAKSKYKIHQLDSMKEKIKGKLSAEQYKVVENDLNFIPGECSKT